MDNKTEALIRELAEKLGTTGEHLWYVLVNQAAISGTINLLVMALWLVVLVWSFFFIRAKTAENANQSADWEDAYAIASWIIWGMAALIYLVISGSFLSVNIAAFVNPEYWALKQLLPVDR